jgi:hypothetical protein
MQADRLLGHVEVDCDLPGGHLAGLDEREHVPAVGSARALSTASGLETMVAACGCLLAFTAVIS